MGALQVSLGHFFTFYADYGSVATPEFGGGNAVLMFFVMSGFLIMIGKELLLSPHSLILSKIIIILRCGNALYHRLCW